MNAENPDLTLGNPPITGPEDKIEIVPASQPISLYEAHESYFQLVWRRFRRSKVSIIGGFMVLILIMLAIFADFFSPTTISEIDLKSSFIPPQQVHFIDHEGNFHLRPFVYNYTYTFDSAYRPIWVEDTSKIYEINFLVPGPEYMLLGL